MRPNMEIVYAILTSWNGPRTYTELSGDYCRRTGIWFQPHSSWDGVLCSLDQMLASAGFPALSARVVLKLTQEPGDGFWGSTPSIPQRPRSYVDRVKVLADLWQEIREVDWPPTLPPALTTA